MIEIREYNDEDFFQVSILIEQVFKKFIIPDASPEGVLFWTDFHSPSVDNQQNIRKRFTDCQIRFVAIMNNKIAGLLWELLQNWSGSLFVKPIMEKEQGKN